MDGPRGGIRLGRAFGAPVVLAPSWFAVAAVVVVTFAPSVESTRPGIGAGAYVVAAAYALLLLASVLVHELAHAACARATGQPVTRIVADLWGGHTQFGQDSARPGPSAAVAVAGPLANAALAALGWVVRSGLEPGVLRLLAVALTVTNVFVAVFNLLPGLPLDGGRVVESLVWALTGRRHVGTLVAGWCGRAVAVLVLAWALVLPVLRGAPPTLSSLVWGGLVAAFLWSGASSAVAVAAVRRRAGGISPGDLLERAVGCPAGASLQDVVDLAVHEQVHHVVLLDAAGRPEGVVDGTSLAGVPAERRPLAPASSVAQALPPDAVLDLPARGEDLLRALSERPAAVYVVLDERRRVVGLLRGQVLADAVTGRRTAA